MTGRKRQSGQQSNTGGQPGRGADRFADDQREEAARQVGEGKDDDTPIWEWIIAAVGLVLVGGTIGFMLYQAVWRVHSPPDIIIQVDAITPGQTGYLVRFRAVNQGGATAEGVVVIGDLTRDDERIEQSQTTFDYLPAHSERRGGLFFAQNPQQFKLKLMATGYQEP